MGYDILIRTQNRINVWSDMKKLTIQVIPLFVGIFEYSQRSWQHILKDIVLSPFCKNRLWLLEYPGVVYDL